MRSYLNKDDVIVPSQPTGIRRFCTPTGLIDQAQPKKRKSDEAGGGVSRKRISRVLPEFEADQTADGSDDDLPSAFEISMFTSVV